MWVLSIKLPIDQLISLPWLWHHFHIVFGRADVRTHAEIANHYSELTLYHLVTSKSVTSLMDKKLFSFYVDLHDIFGLVKIDHPSCKRDEEETDGHHVHLHLNRERVIQRRRLWRHFWTRRVVGRNFFGGVTFLIRRCVGCWIAVTLKDKYDVTHIFLVSQSSLS